MSADTMKRFKRTYHTDIQLLASKDLLSQELMAGIPKSTLSTFRKRDYSRIYGIEFMDTVQNNMRFIEAYNDSLEIQKCCNAIINH